MNQDDRETSIIKKDNSELEQSNKNEEPTTINFNGDKSFYVKEADNVNNTINANITINNNGNNDKNTSENKKKRLKRLIYIIPIVIILVVSVILIYRFYKYVSYMDEAYLKNKTNNELEAVELNQKASSYALTRKQYYDALNKQGISYLNEAIGNRDKNNAETNQSYLKNAYECFDSVMSQADNTSSSYYDAIVGKCRYYYFSKCSPDNEEWKSIIAELEEYANNLELDETNKDDLFKGFEIYNALATYYGRYTNSSSENFNYKNTSKNLEYSTKQLNYLTKYNNKANIPYDIEDSIIDNIDLIELGISDESALYTGNDKLLEYANSLENTLKNIKDNNLKVKPSTLFQLNYVLGENYSVIFIYTYKKPIFEEYRQKAYDTLSKLLYTSPELAKSHHIGIAYFCARTCICTDEDLHQIIENYKTYFNTISLEKNNAEYIHNALSALYTCAFISIAYDNHTESDAYALQLAEQLLKQSTYIDDNRLATIQNYYNYFNHSGGDISQEIKLYDLINCY